MQVSYKFLQQYVPNLNLLPSEIATALTMKSYEVEEIIDLAKDLKGVIVGEIREIIKHPKADRLQITKTFVGEDNGGLLQIVCGAKNIEIGQKVPVAIVGTLLPGNFEIKKAKIRDIESFGMLCSEKELGLVTTDHAGILILDKEAEIGSSFNNTINKDDILLEIDILPNRASDSLSQYGVARELAHVLNKPLKPLNLEGSTFEPLQQINVNLDQSVCSTYSLLAVNDIQDLHLPKDVTALLANLGHSQIHPLVDLSNYVMQEIGQPLHVFDRDKLHGQEIIVRQAKQGEQFVSLDKKTVLLEAGDIVICDSNNIISLAGIIGGLHSSVGEHTQNILVESANFNKAQIRKTARRLGLITDASKRFEKGLPVELAYEALKRFAVLLDQSSSKELQYTYLQVGSNQTETANISVTYRYIQGYLGIDLEEAEIVSILKNIDCQVSTDKLNEAIVFNVSPPFYRLDLNTPEDIIEEIARLYGYDKIPAKTDFEFIMPVKNPNYEFISSIKQSMTSLGYTEIITYPYSKSGQIELLNPVNKQEPFLRTSLKESLTQARVLNSRNFESFSLFEIGTVFLNSGEEQYLAFTKYNKFDKDSEEIVLQKLTYVLHQILELVKIESSCINIDIKNQGWLDVFCKETLIGQISLAEQIVEISLTRLIKVSELKSIVFKELPQFPAVKRDLTISIPAQVSTQIVLDIIQMHKGLLCTSCEYIDKFVKGNTNNVTFRLTYRALDRSLSDGEVNKEVELLKVAIRSVLKY